MEDHRITVTDTRAGVEVLHTITQVVADTTSIGATIDVVDRPARTVRETTRTKNGDGTAKRDTSGICRQILVSVVRPIYLFLQ